MTAGGRLAVGLGLATVVACAEPETTPATALPGPSPFEYPLELWDRRIEGAALLLLHVSDAGVVDSAIVKETSGHAAFDSAAVQGARELQFSPARRGDRRVDSWVELPVRFNLEGGPPHREPRT